MVIRKGDIIMWVGVASIHFVPAIVTQTTKWFKLKHYVRWFDRPSETPYSYNNMEVIRLYCPGGKLF